MFLTTQRTLPIRFRHFRAAGVSLAALTVLGLAPTLHAEPATPTVETILSDFVTVTGGKAAYAKITSTTATGTVSIMAQNINGTFDIKTKAPNKSVTIITLAGIGKQAQGFDGKVGWSQDPINGVRTLAGAELEQARLQARANAPLAWKELYPKSELLGVKTVNGVQAYAVRLTPKSGNPITQYYDVKTKLWVRQDMVADTPQGQIPIETYFSDWRAVDGVKSPFVVRLIQAGAIELLLTTKTIKNNVSIPDSAFAKPADKSKPSPAK